MGTLYIDRKELEVRLDGDAIAFYVNSAKEGTVPIKPLSRVVMCGSALIDSAVLGRLAEENISVLFLSGKRNQFKGMLHGKLHNNGLLRLKQYEKVSSPFAVQWAQELVFRKIKAQKELLTEVFDLRPDRRSEITRSVSSLEAVFGSLSSVDKFDPESLRGFEGGAAAAYFRAYVSLFPESLNFSKRSRRPPADPVNAVLSLTYTMLHFEAVREIELIGLDPTIGFYHNFEYGRESLACDIIEPFRPVADRWVWRLFADRVFTNADFTTGLSRPGCYLKKEGRKEFYLRYEEWADAVRSALTSEVRMLAKSITEGAYGEDDLP